MDKYTGVTVEISGVKYNLKQNDNGRYELYYGNCSKGLGWYFTDNHEIRDDCVKVGTWCDNNKIVLIDGRTGTWYRTYSDNISTRKNISYIINAKLGKSNFTLKNIGDNKFEFFDNKGNIPTGFFVNPNYTITNNNNEVIGSWSIYGTLEISGIQGTWSVFRVEHQDNKSPVIKDFGTSQNPIQLLSQISIPCKENLETLYTSIYCFSQIKGYCSANSSGVENVTPCYGTNLPYYHELYARGFHNIADFNDSRILVGKDLGPGEFIYDQTSFTIVTQIPARNDGSVCESIDELKAMRFYLPPGTINLTFTVNMSFASNDVYAIRLYKPVESTKCSDSSFIPSSYYLNNDDLSELYYHDLFLRNRNGYVQINANFSNALFQENAGWFYVKMLECNSDQIDSIVYTAEVDLYVFMSWFNYYLNWDVIGDPLPLIGHPTGEVL